MEERIDNLTPGGPYPGAAWLNRLVDTVNNLQDRLNALEQHDPAAPRMAVIPVRRGDTIDGRDGWFAGRRFYPPADVGDSGDLEARHVGTAAEGDDCYVVDVGHLPGVELGVALSMHPDGKPVLAISLRMIPVDLTQDGGDGGDQSAYCSFTYAVKYAGTTTVIATEVELTGNGNRWVKTAMTAGTKGWGYFAADGAFVLLFADERAAAQKDCEVPA